jgi:hypothetical protein
MWNKCSVMSPRHNAVRDISPGSGRQSPRAPRSPSSIASSIARPSKTLGPSHFHGALPGHNRVAIKVGTGQHLQDGIGDLIGHDSFEPHARTGEIQGTISGGAFASHVTERIPLSSAGLNVIDDPVLHHSLGHDGQQLSLHGLHTVPFLIHPVRMSATLM